MNITGVCYIRGDGDMIEEWLQYYTDLGVDRFFFWTHGRPEENERLMDVAPRWKATICGGHGDIPFEPTHCKRVGIREMFRRAAGDWVVMADSDELLELPLGSFPEMVRHLSRDKFGTFSAPQLERIAADGTMMARVPGLTLHENYPLCVPGMRTHIGEWYGTQRFRWEVDKYILYRLVPGLRIGGTGYHVPPVGVKAHPRVRGVTHHFMWRAESAVKFGVAIGVGHSARKVRYDIFQRYLDAHDGRLPAQGSFVYSREEMMARGYLSLRTMKLGSHQEAAAGQPVRPAPLVLCRTKVVDQRAGSVRIVNTREVKGVGRNPR